MADEEKIDEKDDEKKWTDADIAERIQGRVKNLHTKNEDLEARLSEMEASQQAQIQPPMAEAPAPLSGGSLSPSGSDEKKWTDSDVREKVKKRVLNLKSQRTDEDEPEVTLSNTPLTADSVQAMLDNQERQRQEEAQKLEASKALNYHQQNVQKMISGDDKFKKLNETSTHEIPDAVQVHLSNNLNHDQAKKIFTELLSNEGSFLRMKNDFLEGNYQKWLSKMLNNSNSDETAPEPVVELGDEVNTSGSSGSDNSKVMDYMRSR